MRNRSTKTITRADLQACENYEATYAPEDDKIRLYVGRVPREEYDFLRAEGWTSTPKQSEAGQGEFSAVWTPAREATALHYAGEIGDEDTPRSSHGGVAAAPTASRSHARTIDKAIVQTREWLAELESMEPVSYPLEIDLTV